MTLVEKIITLAALDMPTHLIVNELSHQYRRASIKVAISKLRALGVLAPWKSA